MARVLVVARDRTLLQVLHSALSRDGHSVLMRDNSPSGIDAFCLNDPDMTILDWQIDGMTGLDLARHMTTIKPSPAIVLTAAHPHEEVRQTQLTHRLHLVSKDTPLTELMRLVQQFTIPTKPA